MSAVFIRLSAALDCKSHEMVLKNQCKPPFDCKLHLNIGYLSLWDTWYTSTFRMATLAMMIHHYKCVLFMTFPPMMKCARDAEENRMRKRAWSTKRSQSKTERHQYISIR